MSSASFTHQSVTLKYVTEDDLSDVQNILDHAAYYHSTIVQTSPSGLAERCFHSEPPKLKDSRVFKRFMLVTDSSLSPAPIAALDIFVGFPNYKTASIAMCVIREDFQRKGLGLKLLTEVIPAFLRETHPAVEQLSISLTENNIPALRCLLKAKYEQTNRWEKLNIHNKPVIALTYKRNVRQQAPNS
ncbi:MAG: GNAT family N-acetyltransferase [Proteobacteria bacterium]|nr:GNAT family N-acetyltransferase [Pseudomonadota bacterium]